MLFSFFNSMKNKVICICIYICSQKHCLWVAIYLVITNSVMFSFSCVSANLHFAYVLHVLSNLMVFPTSWVPASGVFVLLSSCLLHRFQLLTVLQYFISTFPFCTQHIDLTIYMSLSRWTSCARQKTDYNNFQCL